MHFHVLTLFPDMIRQGFSESITGRAMENGLLSLTVLNIRDYAEPSRKRRVDDYPYGGGAGMVMQAEPVYQAWKAACGAIGSPSDRPVRTVYLTPGGRVFSQPMARELAKEEDLIMLCGHYEGIDERVIDEIVTDRVSIGDYVLTGGELPALVMMDAISRMVPGVLGNSESAVSESFEGNLLEYPQYSRPEVWHDRAVPPVLLSGHHGNVDRWRREQSILRTLEVRPELLEHAVLDKKEAAFLKNLLEMREKSC